MSKRLISVLAFAFLVSAAASLLLYRLVANRIGNAPQQVSTQLVIATRDLPIGTLISDVDLKLGDWAGAVPQQALLKPEDAVGRGVLSNIYAGEPILEGRLAPKGAGAGLSATIPQGMRAVALRVNEIVGVAGFVVPGMKVDVIVMGNPPGGASRVGSISRTILQNIEVLSAGQNMQRDAEGKPVSVQVVNVLVTPAQAEILSLASNEARIQLVLRNPLDTDEAETTGTATANLFSGVPFRAEAPAAAPRRAPSVAPRPIVAAKPVPVVVEVITGTRKSETKFSQDLEERP